MPERILRWWTHLATQWLTLVVKVGSRRVFRASFQDQGFLGVWFRDGPTWFRVLNLPCTRKSP